MPATVAASAEDCGKNRRREGCKGANRWMAVSVREDGGRADLSEMTARRLSRPGRPTLERTRLRGARCVPCVPPSKQEFDYAVAVQSKSSLPLSPSASPGPAPPPSPRVRHFESAGRHHACDILRADRSRPASYLAVLPCSRRQKQGGGTRRKE